MRLTFAGGAGTVTGSRTVVESGTTRLLVDCGLFQGGRTLQDRNRQEPSAPWSSVDAIALTHAHLDHSGLVPVAIRDGFQGPVICTSGTNDLCQILLKDAGYLQEEQARHANRRRGKRAPITPLFTQVDADHALSRFAPTPYGTTGRVGDLEISFSPAGHILGSASILVSDGECSVLFSGDLGREGDPLMLPPTPPPAADFVVVESTYGARRRSEEDIVGRVAELVNVTVDRGGVLLVPAFSVGRAQSFLHILAQLRAANQIPEVPTFLNSPMAINATKIFCDHAFEHRLTPEQCRRMCTVARYVNRVEESRALNRLEHPAIIISASGMATGGRILHHLKAYLPDPRSAVFFLGFQARSTRGHALVGGAKTVRIHGEDVEVRARVLQTDALSAHADSEELVAWLERLRPAPRVTFVNHGEPRASEALAQRLSSAGHPSRIAKLGETVNLRA